MNKYRKKRAQLVAQEMTQSLAQQGYTTYYAEDLAAARKQLFELIPQGASVGVGGSETLAAMDIFDELRNGDYHFLDRYQKLPFEQTEEIYRQALTADIFISSTNAITRQGELVNIDSSGNRVAALSFGPRRVILVVGANKVVEDLNEAMVRLRTIAPMNAMRVHHETPCTHTGKCEDCELAQSVCNSIGIIANARKKPGHYVVIMVAEEVGF